jgi:ribose transport system ATP-binding protein
VSISPCAAAVHALVGENRAGKSTLMKVLSGAYVADAGRMELAGQPYAPRGPLDAQRLGVAMIYQELTLALHLTVEQNIVLGREPRRFQAGRSTGHARERGTGAGLAGPAGVASGAPRLGSVPRGRASSSKSRALVSDARVVVMDEPTSLAVKPERAAVCGHRPPPLRGVAVVYISHFLEEMRRVAQQYRCCATAARSRPPTCPPHQRAIHCERARGGARMGGPRE